jgi:hypothetical protein
LGNIKKHFGNNPDVSKLSRESERAREKLIRHASKDLIKEKEERHEKERLMKGLSHTILIIQQQQRVCISNDFLFIKKRAKMMTICELLCGSASAQEERARKFILFPL